MILRRHFRRALLAAGLVALFVTLLFGCREQERTSPQDMAVLAAHKPHPPMPNAVPKGMNK